MQQFDKSKIDSYKNRLTDYFHLQGVDVEVGHVSKCPFHDDRTPSFNVFYGSDGFMAFKCFACGAQGDIYNAVERFTGETDFSKQFEEIDRAFGTGDGSYSLSTLPLPPKKEVYRFSPDKEAFTKLLQWLSSLPNKEENILSYFKQRIEYKTGGKDFLYPLTEEQLQKLVTFFFWWPGAKAAENALGKTLLFRAGVPYTKTKNGITTVDEYLNRSDFPPVGVPEYIYLEQKTEICYRWNSKSGYIKLETEERDVAWWHTGVLAKSPDGFKLLYMNEKDFESKKQNPRAGVHFFPIPKALSENRPIVLMEGEIDAILCQTMGIDNAYSMGGLGNLSVPLIEKFIIPKNIPEIILFADNDKAPKCLSQKAFGLLPYEASDDIIRETIPEKLLKAGFKGRIKVTSLPPDCGFKDPDDAVRGKRFDLVVEAIQKAREYIPFEKPKRERKRKINNDKSLEEFITDWEPLPIKFLRSFLKKVKFDDLLPEEIPVFVAAAKSSCKDEGTIQAIIEWSAENLSEDDILNFEKKEEIKASKITEHPLYSIAAKYGASRYLLERLENTLIPAAEILNMISPVPTIFSVDYDKMTESKNFQTFLHYSDHAFGSYAVAEALKDRLLYINTQESNYVFVKDRWHFVPSIATESHAILLNALLCYLRKYPKDKKLVTDCIEKIGTTPFRRHLAFDLNNKENQFYHDETTNPVLFDSRNIQETITLMDGVLDFSGDKIRFRHGRPEEYRLTELPYTCKQIKDAGTPEFFLKALDLDFDTPSDETLKINPTLTKDTLLYYLSLIPSRNVSKNYSCFMTGPGGTGKSTLISAITDIFTTNCCANLKAQVLISNRRGFDNENGPTPELADLEGKMVSFTMELPEDGRLNSDQLKRLTGNDLIQARRLRQDLHKFLPTAQIVIVGNELPSFYKHDSGIIRRLLVFHFNVEHGKRAKDPKYKKLYKDLPSDSSAMVKKIVEEAPAIIKLLAEKYIELKQKYNLIIPTSQECENAKSSYIEAQSKDTDEFYERCIKFTPNDDKSFIYSKDLYKCYLNFKGYQEGSPEALKQRNFIFYLKKDHPELGGKNYCQRRRDAASLPEWGFKFISFTDAGTEYVNGKTETSQNQELPFNKKQSESAPPEPEDNPFDGYEPAQNNLISPGSDDDDNSDMDIF